MTKVVFVGDEPSKTNVSPDVAFVGAKCFSTVVRWIKELEPEYYVCLNSDTISQISDIKALQKVGFKVVALGTKASERLNSKNIIHFQLPHPSGRNRLLNDKEYMNRELRVCYDYIHDVLVGVVGEN